MKNINEKEKEHRTAPNNSNNFLKSDDEPLAVIQYNYLKLLVRWLFLYCPGTGVFMLPFMRPSSGWIWLTISSVLVIVIIIMCLVRPINMKSVSIYNSYIRQRYRIFGKDKIISINRAYYSSEDRWLREYIGISEVDESPREKKKLFLKGLEEIQINQGFVDDASLKKIYSVLGQITGRNTNEFRHMAGKLMK
ncbi:MAG: hypothetical protein ABFD75_00590 [Smithella sp.]